LRTALNNWKQNSHWLHGQNAGKGIRDRSSQSSWSQSPVFVVSEKERSSGAEVWSDTKVMSQSKGEIWQLYVCGWEEDAVA